MSSCCGVYSWKCHRRGFGLAVKLKAREAIKLVFVNESKEEERRRKYFPGQHSVLLRISTLWVLIPQIMDSFGACCVLGKCCYFIQSNCCHWSSSDCILGETFKYCPLLPGCDGGFVPVCCGLRLWFYGIIIWGVIQGECLGWLLGIYLVMHSRNRIPWTSNLQQKWGFEVTNKKDTERYWSREWLVVSFSDWNPQEEEGKVLISILSPFPSWEPHHLLRTERKAIKNSFSM